MCDAATKKGRAERHALMRHCSGVVTAAALLGVCGSAGAFDIDTGSDDVKLSWDNTFRYTYSARLQKQNKSILASPNYDDGDRNFDRGTIMNRLDLLSELGVVYKKNYGVHLSGAGWLDGRYYTDLDNKSVATSNHLDKYGNQSLGLSGDTKDQNKRGGELLDAFAFANFDVAGIPASVKVGRSTLIYGEGLLNAIHSIAYSQNPLDFAKATAQPGVEVKEVFRPQNQVNVTVQPIESLTVGAQYMLQWEEDRFAETGSYFAAYDFALRGGQVLLPGIRQGGLLEPHQAGDYGFSVRWTPELLQGGTIGLYYRNFSDKIPQVALATDYSRYFWTYGDDISLYGISYGKQLAGTSIGAEASYRTNMPLASSAGFVSANPKKGDTFGARGDTFHALVNALRLFPKTPLWDSLTVMGEVDYSNIVKVTDHPELYLDRPDYNGIDKPTKHYMEATVNVAPLWYQALPGVDVSLPLSVGSGLMGVSGVSFGGAKKSGSYSVGIGADFFQKYKADLKWSGYFGDTETDPATGAISSFRGYALYKDRGFLSLTLKATF